MEEIVFKSTFNMPKYIGYYNIGGNQGVCIHFIKKPKWIQRYFMKILLGWEWHDTDL
jgi:hypothetical protein